MHKHDYTLDNIYIMNSAAKHLSPVYTSMPFLKHLLKWDLKVDQFLIVPKINFSLSSSKVFYSASLAKRTSIFSTTWPVLKSISTQNTFPSSLAGKTITRSLKYESRINESQKVTNKTKVPVVLKFDDFQRAFRLKHTSEIIRSLVVLKLSSYDVLVHNANQLIVWGRRLLSKRVFDYILKRVVYQQFVAGENKKAIQECVTKLQDAGIQAMLAVPIEEDLKTRGEDGNTEYCVYDANLEIMLNCFTLSSLMQPKCPIVQIRMTALASPALLAKISRLCPNPVKSQIIDDVVCGLKSGEWVSLKGLTGKEETELNKVIKRLITIGETAKENGVMVMMDAEYIYFSGAIRLFILSLMLVYNKTQALLCYTYQNYLKNTYGILQQDVQFIHSRNRYFGCKLVRGAYMYKERELAERDGYPDPIHDNFEDTSSMYRQSADYLLDHVAKNSRCVFMVASHNESTINYVVARANELNIRPDCGQLFFGQLLGMCDHVSFTLGEAGYLIYKSVPYGSIDHTIPYLIRRAQENRSFLPGARTEVELLKKTLWHRCGI